MVGKLRENGAQLSQKYNIYSTKTMNSNFPALQDFSKQWSNTLQRDVNVVGVPSTPVRDATEYMLASPK